MLSIHLPPFDEEHCVHDKSQVTPVTTPFSTVITAVQIGKMKSSFLVRRMKESCCCDSRCMAGLDDDFVICNDENSSAVGVNIYRSYSNLPVVFQSPDSLRTRHTVVCFPFVISTSLSGELHPLQPVSCASALQKKRNTAMIIRREKCVGENAIIGGILKCAFVLVQ